MWEYEKTQIVGVAMRVNVNDSIIANRGNGVEHHWTALRMQGQLEQGATELAGSVL